jgi:hypothetical protein
MAVCRCELCELGILKRGGRYAIVVPAAKLTESLASQNVLKKAFRTSICPICGNTMVCEKKSDA